MEQLQQWRKPDGTLIRIPIEEEVRAVLVKEKAQGNSLKVCIGTDSQVKGSKTEFATVVVFIRKGKGGFMYVLADSTRKRHSIKERMLKEVGKSVEVAHSLSGLFTMYNVELEVHADINSRPTFKSNAALFAAMNHVKAMGFAFRAKPDAFASSSCANKMVQ
jgi:uncharacterized protein